MHISYQNNRMSHHSVSWISHEAGAAQDMSEDTQRKALLFPAHPDRLRSFR